MKKCDHTSVGMLVWQNDNLLLIERRNPPFGFAPPAGHVDQDSSFEKAALRELEEEVGLEVKSLKMIIEGRKENKCRREDGNWHHFKIYECITDGCIKRSLRETKAVGWYSRERLAELSKRTEKYQSGEINEDDWEKSPGIEPVRYEWFKDLNVI